MHKKKVGVMGTEGGLAGGKCEIGCISTKKETPERGLWWFDVSLLYNSSMNTPLGFFFSTQEDSIIGLFIKCKIILER